MPGSRESRASATGRRWGEATESAAPALCCSLIWVVLVIGRPRSHAGVGNFSYPHRRLVPLYIYICQLVADLTSSKSGKKELALLPPKERLYGPVFGKEFWYQHQLLWNFLRSQICKNFFLRFVLNFEVKIRHSGGEIGMWVCVLVGIVVNSFLL